MDSRGWEFHRLIPLVTIHGHCSCNLFTFLEVFFFNKSLINTEKRASSGLFFAQFLKCFIMNYFILYIEWYHRVDGHEFEQAPAVGDGQRSLACCSPWGRSQTWLSDWTELTLNETSRFSYVPQITWVLWASTCNFAYKSCWFMCLDSSPVPISDRISSFPLLADKYLLILKTLLKIILFVKPVLSLPCRTDHPIVSAQRTQRASSV